VSLRVHLGFWSVFIIYCWSFHPLVPMSVSLRGDCQASGQFIVRYWSVLSLVPSSHRHSITGLHSVHSPVLASSPRYHPFVKSVWIVGVSLVSRAVSARQIVSSPLVKSVLVSCPIHVCVSPPRFPPVSPHVAFFSCQSSHAPFSRCRPLVSYQSPCALSNYLPSSVRRS
jgi:hypothetical protein